MNFNEFQPRNILEYPPTNNYLFEEFFFDNYKPDFIERIYLPIFWTNFYIKNDFGGKNIDILQKFLDSLDSTKKYFTIVQYDDNILNNLENLDIMIFAQGGFGKYEKKTYPIPLNYEYPKIKDDKTIFASFIGKIFGRHNLREKMFDTLKTDDNFLISENTNYNHFRSIMQKSIFSLCPRGYGQTSFRICEALQSESIPVYIYDTPFLPFNSEISFEDYGILIPEQEISDISKILKSKSDKEIKTLIENGKIIYEKYFTYRGCFDNILKILS